MTYSAIYKHMPSENTCLDHTYRQRVVVLTDRGSPNVDVVVLTDRGSPNVGSTYRQCVHLLLPGHELNLDSNVTS
jgi:hypothetical protein